MDQNHYKTLNKHSANLFKAVFKPFICILKRFLAIFSFILFIVFVNSKIFQNAYQTCFKLIKTIIKSLINIAITFLKQSIMYLYKFKMIFNVV